MLIALTILIMTLMFVWIVAVVVSVATFNMWLYMFTILPFAVVGIYLFVLMIYEESRALAECLVRRYWSK